MKEKNTFCENEEISRFGEFVTSYFGWLPISKQKDRAEGAPRAYIQVA